MTTTQASTIDVEVVWLIRRNMPEVLAIEEASYSPCWTEADFLHCLRQRNCIGMVAVYQKQVVGFVIYELGKGYLDILNIAVDPRFRGRTVARQIIDRMKKKLEEQRRTHLMAYVRETNLSAQLFFRRMGFVCGRIADEHYEDDAESAYVFRWFL